MKLTTLTHVSVDGVMQRRRVLFGRWTYEVFAGRPQYATATADRQR